jgi:hypothetical protein
MGRSMSGEAIADAANDKWIGETRKIVAATVAILVLYLAWYLHRHGDFSNDDLDNFVLMQHMGFWEFFKTPTDVHYVPLHRLMSWVVYHVAPMNFSVAIAVLLAFHIGTLIFLARSLRLLRAGQTGGLIVCGYAASALIVYGLIWWAHAEHRAPYVFLDVFAIYSYLAWMERPRRRHLVLAVLAFVLAFGFYEKAVLIPVHMALIGYLGNERDFRVNARRWLTPPFLLLLGSSVYVLGYMLLNKGAVQSSPFQAIRADVEFVKAFFATASAISTEDVHDVPTYGMSLRLLCLIVAGSLVLGWSVRRGQGSWKVVLAAIFIVFLDDAPIVLSNRGSWIGFLVTHQARFGYEELHLLALLMGIWCYRIGIVGAMALHRRMAWSLGFGLMMVYAAVNVCYVQWGRQHPLGLLWDMDQSRVYLRNLRAGLAQEAGDCPAFENDQTPHYLSLFRITPDTRTLLPLFLAQPKFDDMALPRCEVTQGGEVVRLQ